MFFWRPTSFLDLGFDMIQKAWANHQRCSMPDKTTEGLLLFDGQSAPHALALCLPRSFRMRMLNGLQTPEHHFDKNQIETINLVNLQGVSQSHWQLEMFLDPHELGSSLHKDRSRSWWASKPIASTLRYVTHHFAVLGTGRDHFTGSSRQVAATSASERSGTPIALYFTGQNPVIWQRWHTQKLIQLPTIDALRKNRLPIWQNLHNATILHWNCCNATHHIAKFITTPAFCCQPLQLTRDPGGSNCPSWDDMGGPAMATGAATTAAPAKPPPPAARAAATSLWASARKPAISAAVYTGSGYTESAATPGGNTPGAGLILKARKSGFVTLIVSTYTSPSGVSTA